MIFRKESKVRKKVIGLSFYCITLSIICQVFSSFASAASASSTVNQFYFQDFTADYYLSRAEDGTSKLKVVERFIAVFPKSDQNHGITRVIPYTNQDGKNLTMPSDQDLNIKVKHNGITEEPYKIEPGKGYFTVYLGDPTEYVHDRQMYELEYEFQNVITAPDDNPGHQELYWDTNGNDWSQRFDKLTARVHFVGDAVSKAFDGRYACYVGRYGSSNSNRCQVTKTENGIEFRAEELNAYENLTFALEFDNDTFTIPETTYDYRILGAIIVEAIVALSVLIVVLVVHYQTKTKRTYYKGLFIVPEYTPPKDFTVAEMDVNYVGKKSLLTSNKVATLMELAVTGKIELSKLGTEKKPKWTVKILSCDLSSEQADILKLLAGRDATLETGQEILIKTHDYDPALARLSEKYNKHIDQRLFAAGLYEAQVTKTGELRNKHKTNLCDVLLTFGVVWIIVAIISLAFLFEEIPSYITLFGGGWLIAIMLIKAIAIAIAAFWASSYYRKFYTHTELGLKWSRYLDGLKLYIKMAEQDRIRFLQSVKGVDTSNQGIVNLYEKLLPYAVIFGLEKTWLKEMGKYYEMNDVSTPVWYVGGAIFSAHDFSNAMRSVGSVAAGSISHSTTPNSSSSSSGFSGGGGGGGFSGGGGGGGGGGGW